MCVFQVNDWRCAFQLYIEEDGIIRRDGKVIAYMRVTTENDKVIRFKLGTNKHVFSFTIHFVIVHMDSQKGNS